MGKKLCYEVLEAGASRAVVESDCEKLRCSFLRDQECLAPDATILNLTGNIFDLYKPEILNLSLVQKHRVAGLKWPEQPGPRP